GASLVGKNVIVPGNKLDIADGTAQGGFELTSAADAVKMEVLSPAGQVLDTVALGAQSAGMHSFDWAAGSYTNTSGLTFRITATTMGAKSSRAECADMYASAISGNNIGIGVNLQAVTQQFTQGNISTTTSPLDLAINGGGFFEVSNGSQTLYTRNGQFQADKD